MPLFCSGAYELLGKTFHNMGELLLLLSFKHVLERKWVKRKTFKKLLIVIFSNAYVKRTFVNFKSRILGANL